MEFWVRYNESSDEDAVVMTKGGIPGSGNGNFQVTLEGTGDARHVRFAFNGFTDDFWSSSEIPAEQWTHVAMTWDGSTYTLYLNGEQDAQQGEGSSPDSNTAPVHFGVDDSEGGHFFDGRVDDVRIWRDSRNLIEIQNNLFNELEGSEQGLQALYSFDENGLSDEAGTADLSTFNNAKLVDPDASLNGVTPPFLQATPQSDKVLLNWTRRSAGPVNAPAPDSYEIYRSASPEFTTETPYAILAGSTDSWVDTTAQAGTTYYYQIRPVNADGDAAGYSKSTAVRAYVERGGGSLDLEGRGYGVLSDRPSADIKGNEFAMEFWLKFKASSDEDAVVVTKGGIPDSNTGNYRVTLEGDGEARRIQFAFNGFTDTFTSNTEVQAGQWTHVAMAWDGETYTLYLNGEQDAQQDEGSPPDSNTAPVHFGVDDSEGGHFLNGSIDDFRLWSDNRPRSEVQANYRNRLIGDEEGLLNYFRFNEIGGTDTARSSETKKSLVSLEGDAEIEAGGAYPVAPYVFATSENAASNVTYENRMDEPLDSLHYQFTVGGAPTAGAGSEFQPSAFKPRDVAGLTNGVTHEHYLQAEVDGQRSDFSRAATATPYAERGGSSLSVNGGSYGTVSDRPTLNLDNEFTMEFWVKYDASSDEDAVIMTKGGTPGSSTGNYRVTLEGTGEDRRVRFAFNGFTDDLWSSSGIPAKVWTHVALSYDGNTYSLYVNGELDTQMSDSSPNSNNAPLRFGTDDPATGHYLDGHIDEVAFWDDSRTDEEVATSYVNGFIGNESGLEHYWRFDESDRSEARGSASWHATVETRDGGSLGKPGVLPVPPRTFARGQIDRTEVVWRVRNRPDDVYVYRSSARDRSDRTLTFQANADQRSVLDDRQVTNNQTVFYETTSLTKDGQESDYSFPASAYPSEQVAGNAWSFNGESSHVTVEDRQALDIHSPFSIEFWVKYNASSDQDAVVVSKGGIPGSESGNYQAYLRGDGDQRKVQFTFNGFHDGLRSETAINAGEWTHVAYTWDGSNKEIYIDGQLDSQGTESSSPEGVSNPLRVGTDKPATGHYLNGSVDDLRISHEPRRTPTEIQETYDRELVGDENGLEGYWRGCYSMNSQDVWGQARKPMTASFTDISCVPSKIGLENESLTSTFNVTLEPNNGLGSYLISVGTNEDTVIRSLEPDLLDGGQFWVYDGGPGEANVTASGSSETGISASNEQRTLITIEFSGNVTRDDLTLDIIELEDDNFQSLPESAVNLEKVGTSLEEVELSLSANATNVTAGETVEFTVEDDATGDLIESATIEVNNETVTTDANGTATYTFEETGNYTATATKDDTASQTFVEDSLDVSVSLDDGEDDSVIVVGDSPAQDLNDDGLYEDVNGDGTFDIVDVSAFFQNYQSQAVKNNTDLFDFNNDGTVDIVDVSALFGEAV